MPPLPCQDIGGIAYFGYAYYANQLTVARIASDKYKGVKDASLPDCSMDLGCVFR